MLPSGTFLDLGQGSIYSRFSRRIKLPFLLQKEKKNRIYVIREEIVKFLDSNSSTLSCSEILGTSLTSLSLFPCLENKRGEQ